MTDPIVHIGYHKTATTWFQLIYYPQVRNLRYVDRLLVKDAFLRHSGFAFRPERAREELELPSPSEAVILCEEELSGYLHNGGLYGFLSKEMAQRLNATFPEARIVVFIRSQPDIIAACYQQYIRGGGTYGTHRYLYPYEHLYGAIAEPYKVPRFSFEHFDYLDLVEHYEELFGREKVHVLLYEDFRRNSRDFLEAFASRFDLEVSLDDVDLKPKNASYSLPIVYLARLLNRFTYRTVNDKRYWIDIPYWYGIRRWILETLNATKVFGSTPSPEELFGAREYAVIQDRYREHNRRLAAHTELPLEECGYPM